MEFSCSFFCDLMNFWEINCRGNYAGYIYLIVLFEKWQKRAFFLEIIEDFERLRGIDRYLGVKLGVAKVDFLDRLLKYKYFE